MQYQDSSAELEIVRAASRRVKSSVADLVQKSNDNNKDPKSLLSRSLREKAIGI
jgi:hypothetical protein